MHNIRLSLRQHWVDGHDSSRSNSNSISSSTDDSNSNSCNCNIINVAAVAASSITVAVLVVLIKFLMQHTFHRKSNNQQRKHHEQPWQEAQVQNITNFESNANQAEMRAPFETDLKYFYCSYSSYENALLSV